MGMDKTTGGEMASYTQEELKTLPDGTYTLDSFFYVRIRNGRGSYFVRMKVDGKRRDITVGSTKDLKLKVAKAKADAIKADVLAGKIRFDKGKDELEREREKEVLFEDFWEGALETYAASRHWKNHDRVIQSKKYSIRTYALPKIGKMMMKDIGRDEVLECISELWHDKPLIGQEIRTLLQKIFGLAVVKGILETNPAIFAGNLEYFLPPPAKLIRRRHFSSATIDETREIIRECIGTKIFGRRVTLTVILTARRFSEICNLRWKDVDLSAGIVLIPDEIMKVSRGVPRRVPLVRQLVDEMKAWDQSTEYVFSPTGKTPITQDSARYSMKCLNGKITMHGFRSTFTDWCAENGVPLEIAEKCLDHEVGSKVRQAYQRSDLLDQRREALQAYADFLFSEIEE